MVLWVLFGIGIGMIVLAGFLGLKYRHYGFERSKFDPWRDNYLRKNPSAEDALAKEYFEQDIQGAPTGEWLRPTYLKELDNGKIAAAILTVIGAILIAISNI